MIKIKKYRKHAKFLVATMALVIALYLNSIYESIGLAHPESYSFSQTTAPMPLIDTQGDRNVKKICDRAQIENALHELQFELLFKRPEPTSERSTKCPWASGDNLEPRRSRLSARFEQTRTLALPEGATVCSIQIEAPPKKFSAQDFYIFTLNGRVIATNATFLLKFFQEESITLTSQLKLRSYIYDWSHILGARTPKNFTSGPEAVEYCIGQDVHASSCSLTRMEQPRLKLSGSLAQWLGTKNLGDNLRWGLIVTGDENVQEDCDHSDLLLQVKILVKK